MNDDEKFRPFHAGLLLYASAGIFCDGYILSSIGLALITLGPHFALSAGMTGLLGAITLFGVLAGALVFGEMADRYGRRILMIADLAVFVIACVAQIFVTNVWELIALRFVLGVAIGADYPISAALIAEFMPRRSRGAALAGLETIWFAGACAAYVAGSAMLALGSDSWKWILAAPAVIAALGLLIRTVAPESPRWLAATAARMKRPGLREIFTKDVRPKLGFVSWMWLLQVVPLFAIYTFAPTVLSALHLGTADSVTGSIAITVAFAAGSLLSLPLIERWGRRPLCIAGFAVATVAFAAIAFGDVPLTVAAFLAYALAMGAASGLEIVYPAELFPTFIRGTATGFAAAVSRVGAFVGTFALPVVLGRYGIAPIVVASVALSVAGLWLAIARAPETKGTSLDSLEVTPPAGGEAAPS
jgi:MFS transporter, putative metabolite transport protein